MARCLLAMILAIGSGGCTFGFASIEGGRASSKPVNAEEERQYKQALIRCHKTGGTRIVKINGLLRCF